MLLKLGAQGFFCYKNANNSKLTGNLSHLRFATLTKQETLANGLQFCRNLRVNIDKESMSDI